MSRKDQSAVHYGEQRSQNSSPGSSGPGEPRSMAEFVMLCMAARRREEMWRRRLQEDEEASRRHRPVAKDEPLPCNPLPRSNSRRRRSSQSMADIVQSKLQAMRMAEDRWRQHVGQQRQEAGPDGDAAGRGSPTPLQLKAARRMVGIINRIAEAKRQEDLARRVMSESQSGTISSVGSSGALDRHRGLSPNNHVRPFSDGSLDQNLQRLHQKRKLLSTDASMQRMTDVNKTVITNSQEIDSRRRVTGQTTQRSPDQDILFRENLAQKSSRPIIHLFGETEPAPQKLSSVRNSLPPI